MVTGKQDLIDTRLYNTLDKIQEDVTSVKVDIGVIKEQNSNHKDNVEAICTRITELEITVDRQDGGIVKSIAWGIGIFLMVAGIIAGIVF